ncbi:MAG TPA: hypothetical protein VMJ64_10655 [Anaerolineales bacterium]|nr:hypothetical protein [Anaerolineales bacterium]
MKSASFRTLATWCAFLAGIAGLLYALSFVILQNTLLSALFLLLGGVASVVVWTGLYAHLHDIEAPFPLLALLLSVGAASGSIIHGGYDLANAIHPPATINQDLPSAIDPRGLLTFGLGCLGLLVFAWLIARDRALPSALAYLGYASAALMAVLYLGRLIILQATNPVIVIAAVLEGFLLNPIWLIWLGIAFRRLRN